MIFRIMRRSWISIINSLKMLKQGRIVSAYALDGNGLAAAVSKMAFGNHKECQDRCTGSKGDLFSRFRKHRSREYRQIKVAELTIAGVVVGEVEDDAVLSYGDVKLQWKGL